MTRSMPKKLAKSLARSPARVSARRLIDTSPRPEFGRGAMPKLAERGRSVRKKIALASSETVTIQRAKNPVHPGGLIKTDQKTIFGSGVQEDPITAGASLTAQFLPDRVLFVSKLWPDGSDPATFFTTISDAIAQAATMSPTTGNQVLIAIYPGTYTENLTLVSNVQYAAAVPGAGAVTLAGNVTWTAGTLVNASQTNVTEQVTWDSIQMGSSSNTFTMTSVGKAAGGVTFFSSEAVYGIPSFTGRAANLDTLFIFLPNFLGTATFTDMTGVTSTIGVELVSPERCRSVNFAGATVARMQSGDNVSGTIALTGTANVTMNGADHVSTVTIASGCTLVASGCNFTSTVTVSSGGTFTGTGCSFAGAITGNGTVDVRGSNYGGNAHLTGSGTINRTTWIGTTGSTSVGANAIALTPNYPDGSYNVHLQLVSGAGNAAATVTAKAGTGFTLTDSVGGNVWDYTVIHD